MNAGTIYPKYTGDWYASSKANFGPRLALTWAPDSLHGDTIFRVGGGIFYGPGQTEDQIQPEANDRVSRTFASGAANQPGAPFSQTSAGSAWGRLSSTVGNQVGIGANRQIQLSLRANF